MGRTPLQTATNYSHVDLVQMLLGVANIQVNALSRRGETAMDLAKKKPQVNSKIITLLSIAQTESTQNQY
jgi:hypothetical protein